tara:strand:- start:595 stop:1680 length:1086 start_codon:yes stop_codon:yes gene_type:complete
MKIEDFIKAKGGEVISSGDTNREELDNQEKPEVQEESKVEEESEVKEEEPEVITDGDTISLEDQLKEKYGSLEGLEEKLRSLEEKANAERLEDKYESKSIDRLSKVLESGFSWDKIKEIAEIKTLDVENMDGRQALSKMLEMKDGLSKREINAKLYEFDQLQKEDTEFMDEGEVIKHEAALAQYERLQNDSKEFLNSVKEDEKYSLPELKSAPDQKELIEKQNKEFEDLKKMYESSVDDSLKSFDSMNITLGEDNEFTFELNDEQKQQVQKQMYGINEYYNNFASADGVDYKKMQETIAKGLFFDQMMKSAVESNINKGKVDAVKDINNIVDKSKKAQAPNSDQSPTKQILEGFLKGQGLK